MGLVDPCLHRWVKRVWGGGILAPQLQKRDPKFASSWSDKVRYRKQQVEQVCEHAAEQVTLAPEVLGTCACVYPVFAGCKCWQDGGAGKVCPLSPCPNNTRTWSHRKTPRVVVVHTTRFSHHQTHPVLSRSTYFTEGWRSRFGAHRRGTIASRRTRQPRCPSHRGLSWPSQPASITTWHPQAT